METCLLLKLLLFQQHYTISLQLWSSPSPLKELKDLKVSHTHHSTFKINTHSSHMYTELLIELFKYILTSKNGAQTKF